MGPPHSSVAAARRCGSPDDRGDACSPAVVPAPTRCGRDRAAGSLCRGRWVSRNGVLYPRSAAGVLVWRWVPRQGFALGIGFVVDPIGAQVAALVGLLFAASMTFAWGYFEEVHAHFSYPHAAIHGGYGRLLFDA